MKKGVIYYKDTYNIGDDVQTLAAKNILGSDVEYIDREALDSYTDPDTKILMNGYFMADPTHWPPNPKVDPYFISFHLSAYKNCEELMLNEESIAYFKKHEPIGCRDKETARRLKAKGVDAYFSSCVTLTLEPTKDKHDSGEILFVDPFLKMNSDSYTDYMMDKMIPSGLKNKTDLIKHDIPEITGMTIEDRLVKTQELLTRYQNASLVFTSRIHCALPCLALGTPVYFMDLGYDRNDARKRFDGITDMMDILGQDKFPGSSNQPFQKVLRNLGTYKFQNLKNLPDKIDWSHAENKTNLASERAQKIRESIKKEFND